jgi:hypothetical protein
LAASKTRSAISRAVSDSVAVLSTSTALRYTRLNPRVRLAACGGGCRSGPVLDDGFDVKHLAGDALGLVLVLQYLAAELGV